MIETASISNDSTSSIQTLLSALESHQFMPYGSLSTELIYRRWGISPRPEALFGFTKLTIARYRNNCKIIFSTNQYVYAILIWRYQSPLITRLVQMVISFNLTLRKTRNSKTCFINF